MTYFWVFFLNKFSLLTYILFLKFFIQNFIAVFQKSLWFKHGDFWISVFQYMEIQKSLCILTWRFCEAKLFIFSNLRISIHRDSKISVYKTHTVHFWISVFQYSEIQKYPCIETRRFKNLCVLFMQIFFKRSITQWNRNRWCKYFRVWIRGLGTRYQFM